MNDGTSSIDVKIVMDENVIVQREWQPGPEGNEGERQNRKRKRENDNCLTVNARGEMIMFPASIIERSDFLRALFSVHSPETAPFVDFHPRILRHVFGAMSPKPLCSNKAHHIKKLNENIHFSRHLAGYLATDFIDHNGNFRS